MQVTLALHSDDGDASAQLDVEQGLSEEENDASGAAAAATVDVEDTSTLEELNATDASTVALREVVYEEGREIAPQEAERKVGTGLCSTVREERDRSEAATRPDKKLMDQPEQASKANNMVDTTGEGVVPKTHTERNKSHVEEKPINRSHRTDEISIS